MDSANCSIGESPRYAQAIHQLTEAERSALRGSFTCTRCGGLAWFRRPAPNNRVACFAAHHHDDCIFKADVEGDAWGDGTEGEVYERLNRGQIIEIDLDYAMDEPVDVDLGPGRVAQVAGGRAHRLPGDLGREGRSHRRLSSLLRLLVTVPEFRGSGQFVVAAGHDPVPVREFFKEFSGNADPPASFGGYWGQIVHSQRSAGAAAGPQLWLIMQGDNSMSCHLDEAMVPALLNRASVQSSDELLGMYVLVLKNPYVMRTGKCALKIRDLRHVAFRRP